MRPQPTNEKLAWDRVALFVVIVLFLGWYIVGCATPNTGQCPPEYRASELRNEGKIVLWCVR